LIAEPTFEITWRKWPVFALGLGLALLTLYAAGIGSISEFLLRGAVLGVSGVIIVLLEPSRRRFRAFNVALDAFLALGFLVSILWFLRLSEELWSGLYLLTSADLWMAGIGLVALLELTRRAIGAPLAVLAGLSLIYALFGDSLPWIFRHAGYSPTAVAQTVWYGLDGVYGLAAAVMVSLVFVYIVFGSVLESTGAGEIMLRMATRSTDGLPGGAAHGAVGASALFGMISGSVTANVVGTGVFTMSLMKKRGFSPAFAGGVEASASAAGQFLPPVMGAAAFLMSELVGISYLTICAAALLPALFFFGSLFVGVWVEAAKMGMVATPVSERVKVSRRDLWQSLLFIGPIATVIAILVSGRSPALAGFAAIVVGAALALVLNPAVRRQPHKLLRGLAEGGLAGARIMVAVGAIGILIGVLNLTGLGTRIAEQILSFGGDSLFLSLVLTMLASIVLGMGLPTLPAYLLIVILIGPVLERMGVPLLAAHLFVMYFAVFSAITPPVALAAFAAAPIVGGSPTQIGAKAIQLSVVGFIIPYVFVYQPELLVIYADSVIDVLWVSLRLMGAIWMFSTALGRFERAPLRMSEACLRGGAGLLLITSVPTAQVAGLVLTSGLVILHHSKLRTESARDC